MVPELAFHPSDIGLSQAGITEAVVQSVSSVAPALHNLLYSNVILTGVSVTRSCRRIIRLHVELHDQRLLWIRNRQ
jgi:hypothetical protein